MGIRGNPAIYLFAVALAAASFGASAAPVCSLSASQISKEIHDKGTLEMMRGLPGNEITSSGFYELVACIGGGKKEWLDIAVPVVAEAKPDTEDDLTDAVQNALVVNPEVVLSEPWPDTFTITDYICSVSVEDYPDYAAVMVELHKRVQIVRRIKKPQLRSKVDECLASFEKAKTNLALFYQTDNTSPAPDPGTAPPAPDPGTAPPPRKY